MEKKFQCRLCGHTEYSTKYQHDGVYGFGSTSTVIFYYCNNCSVIFKNPKQFSVAKTEDK